MQYDYTILVYFVDVYLTCLISLKKYIVEFSDALWELGQNMWKIYPKTFCFRFETFSFPKFIILKINNKIVIIPALHNPAIKERDVIL